MKLTKGGAVPVYTGGGYGIEFRLLYVRLVTGSDTGFGFWLRIVKGYNSWRGCPLRYLRGLDEPEKVYRSIMGINVPLPIKRYLSHEGAVAWLGGTTKKASGHRC